MSSLFTANLLSGELQTLLAAWVNITADTYILSSLSEEKAYSSHKFGEIFDYEDVYDAQPKIHPRMHCSSNHPTIKISFKIVNRV